MAMNGDTLGDAMKTAIDALSFTDQQDRQKALRALGNAIVDHITNNAVVSGNGTYNLTTLVAGATPVTAVPPGVNVTNVTGAVS